MATFKFTRGDGKVLVYIPVKQEMYLTDGPGAEEIEAKHDSSSGVTSGCIPSVRFPPSFDIVDLHLTYACNMNCVYCYANASTKGPVLSRNKILQALNYLFSKSTSDDLRVHFLGGEPTVEWDTLVWTIAEAERRAGDFDKNVSFSMTSNGIWSEDQFDKIINNFRMINISFDGIPDIQNLQRPMRDGANSFETVFKTIKKLSEVGDIELSVKVMVTDKSLPYMADTISFLNGELSGITIQLEPIHPVGTAADSTFKPPRMAPFLEAYLGCLKISDEINASNKLTTSILRGLEYSPGGQFCGCSGRNFIVTAGGLISACDEVTSLDQAGGDTFIFGDVTDGGIAFNEKAYNKLVGLSAEKASKCLNCFALYICRGGCPLSKVLCSRDLFHDEGPDCEGIKKSILKYLWYLAETEPDIGEA